MLYRLLPGLLVSLAVFGSPGAALSTSFAARFPDIGLSAPLTTLSGFGKGTIAPNFSVAGVPMLKSFFFDFGPGEDHHIQHVGVYPETNSTITLAFEDHNGDDEFFYNVEYLAAAPDGTIFGSAADVCKGQCAIPITRPSPASAYVFVLRGFRIFYQGDDHHIDEIAVYESNGLLNVRLNDKNNDDNFVWYVTWTWVPRNRFSTVGTVGGYSCASDNTCDRDSKPVPAGQAVVRGFRFDFTNSDHHLSNIGVFTRNNGVIEAYYGDQNGDDEFYWFVDYAVLAPAVLAPLSDAGAVSLP